MTRSPSPAPSPAEAARRAAGFTLVELMVSLALVGFLLVGIYSILDVNLRTRDVLERDALLARVGPALLDVIEADLRRAWVLDIHEDVVFEGTPRMLGGRNADEMVFLTTVDSTKTHRVGEREVPSDLCETGYRLRTNPTNDDFLELWRRQDYHIDEEPLADGTYELLHDRIVSFQVRYLERLREDERPLDAWIAKDRHELPAAILIDVELEVLPRVADAAAGARAPTLRYQRVVTMPQENALVMRVHPMIPDYIRGGLGGVLGSPSTGGSDEGGLGDADGDGDGDGDEDDSGDDEAADEDTGDDGLGDGGGDPGGDPGGTLDDILNDLLGGGGG